MVKENDMAEIANNFLDSIHINNWSLDLEYYDPRFQAGPYMYASATNLDKGSSVLLNMFIHYIYFVSYYKPLLKAKIVNNQVNIPFISYAFFHFI